MTEPEQSETFFDCPYCAERISVLIDHSVSAQDYIEDCEVCCQPIVINYVIEDGQALLSARREDD